MRCRLGLALAREGALPVLLGGFRWIHDARTPSHYERQRWSVSQPLGAQAVQAIRYM